MSDYRTLETEYAALRSRNKAKEEQNRYRFNALRPDIYTLEQQERALLAKRFGALRKGEPFAEENVLAEIKAKREALLSAEPNRSLLEPVYTCPLCRDTGYVETEQGQTHCACFTQRLLALRYADASLDPSGEQTFENWKAEVYPEGCQQEGVSQRRYMELLRRHGMQYAERFPRNPKRNILITGPTGTGKTFLLNCIAAEVVSRRYSALSVSASLLFTMLRDYAFNGGQIADLLRCDLLVIDELGMEPMFNNVTIEYLFLLFNERYKAKKAMLISTNLSLADLEKRYTERITSRLFDPHATDLFETFGMDIRFLQQ